MLPSTQFVQPHCDGAWLKPRLLAASVPVAGARVKLLSAWAAKKSRALRIALTGGCPHSDLNKKASSLLVLAPPKLQVISKKGRTLLLVHRMLI